MTPDEVKRCAEFLHEIDGGAILTKFCVALAEATAAAVDMRKPASVSWDTKIDPVKNARMVDMVHSIAYTRPTLRGKASEEDNS